MPKASEGEIIAVPVERVKPFDAHELARMMDRCDMCQLHEAHIALKTTELENAHIWIGIQKEEIRVLDRRIFQLYLALFIVALFALWAVTHHGS